MNTPTVENSSNPRQHRDAAQADSNAWDWNAERDSFLRHIRSAMGIDPCPLDWRETTELLYNLEARKSVERAKEWLMKHGRTEQEAYREIHSAARCKRLSLRLAANGLFHKTAD
jgi:hypothetical protein